MSVGSYFYTHVSHLLGFDIDNMISFHTKYFYLKMTIYLFIYFYYYYYFGGKTQWIFFFFFFFLRKKKPNDLISLKLAFILQEPLCVNIVFIGKPILREIRNNATLISIDPLRRKYESWAQLQWKKNVSFELILWCRENTSHDFSLWNIKMWAISPNH